MGRYYVNGLGVVIMLFKIFILMLVVVVLYCLGSGLFFLAKDDQRKSRLVKALTWRIGLSVAIFLLLLLAFVMGWDTPHQILAT